MLDTIMQISIHFSAGMGYRAYACEFNLQTGTAGDTEARTGVRRTSVARAQPARRAQTEAVHDGRKHRRRVGVGSASVCVGAQGKGGGANRCIRNSFSREGQSSRGRWGSERKVWLLPVQQVLQLGLTVRVCLSPSLLCNTRKAHLCVIIQTFLIVQRNGFVLSVIFGATSKQRWQI